MRKIIVLSLNLLFATIGLKAQVEITSSGSGNAYTLSVPGSFQLRDGIQVTFKAHTNSAAGATMNVSGTGNVNISKDGGANAIAAGDIVAGQVVTLAYADAKWQMITPTGTPPAVGLPTGTSDQTLRHDGTNWVASSFLNIGTNLSIGATGLNGRVGIRGNTRATINFDMADNAHDAGISWQNVGGNFVWNIFREQHLSGGNASLVFAGGQNVIGVNNLAERMRISQDGNVGIGTASPAKVAGSNRYLTVSATDVGTTNATTSVELVGNAGALNTMASKIDFLGVTPISDAIFTRARIEARTGNGATGHGQLLFYTFNGTFNEAMRIRESGHIGIGGSGVVGSLLSVGASNQFQINSTGNLIRVNDVPYSWPNANGAGILTNDGTGSLTWAAPATSTNIYNTDGTLSGPRTVTQGTNLLSFTSNAVNGFSVDGTTFSVDAANNRVGIGTSTPGTILTVLGPSSVPTIPNTTTTATFRVAVSAGEGIDFGKMSSSPFIGWMQAGLTGSASDPIVLNPLGGNVGIGTGSTIAPATKLEVKGGQPKTATVAFENVIQISSLDASPLALRFGIKTDGTVTNRYGGIEVDDAGTKRNLVLQPTLGNVGIGITNPSFKLQVENSTLRRTGYFINTLTAGNIVSNEIMGVYGGATGTGASDKIGGYFESSGGTGVNYGVYGQALGGATNWAGYFVGNTYVSGNLGVGITPTQKLHVNGNVMIPAANDYMYASAKTKYYSNGAANFTSDPGLTYIYRKTASTSNYGYISGGSTGLLAYTSTEIQIPDGAIITDITAWIYDNDATYDSRIRLNVVPHAGGTVAQYQTAYTTGASTAIQTVSGNPGITVNNQNNSYNITWETYQNLGTNARIYSVRVTYTVTRAD